MIDPALQWTPSIAVSAISFYTGHRFPKWKNHLFVGSLARQEFRRVEIQDDKVVGQELIFKGLGRIRDIHTGPDGLLYLSVEHFSRNGQIVRLVPAE